MICRIKGCGKGANGSDDLCIRHGVQVLAEQVAICPVCDGLVAKPQQLVCSDCLPFLTSADPRDYGSQARPAVLLLDDHDMNVVAGIFLTYYEMLLADEDGKLTDEIAIAKIALDEEKKPRLAMAYLRRYERTVEYLHPWLADLRKRVESMPDIMVRPTRDLLDEAEVHLLDNHLGRAEMALHLAEQMLVQVKEGASRLRIRVSGQLISA